MLDTLSQFDSSLGAYSNTDWDFPVEMQPVFDSVGNEIPRSQHVIRTDTGDSLGVHGSKYQIIKHDDVVNSVMDAIKSKHNQLGTDYNAKFFVIENGRKLRGEIRFPNERIVDPEVNDHIEFRVQFYNSYDGSWAFQQSTDALRLWCLNGCTTPDSIAKTWAKHTTKVNVEGSGQKILNGLDIFKNNKQLFDGYRSTPVTTEDAESFFKSTLCKTQTKGSALKFNDRQLQALLGNFDNESAQLGRNQWALYNAMTYWSTHCDGAVSPENTRRIREGQLIKALKSNQWEEIQ